MDRKDFAENIAAAVTFYHDRMNGTQLTYNTEIEAFGYSSPTTPLPDGEIVVIEDCRPANICGPEIDMRNTDHYELVAAFENGFDDLWRDVRRTITEDGSLTP